MPIPKAPLGEEFGYDFQYLILLPDVDGPAVFLDAYRYEPVYPPLAEDGSVWLSAEDLRRIYAPYLAISEEGGRLALTYCPPLRPSGKAVLEAADSQKAASAWYVRVVPVMRDCFGKPGREAPDASLVAVDGKKPVEEAFPSPMALLPQRNRLQGKIYGEQDYSLWMEEANRLIPYRMYIPCSYRPGVPQKAVVCFHGGDANADYMFRHTGNAICRWAEKQGYILLALTSYRKYTFFGASKVPTGKDSGDPADPNPCGLTEEEQRWCQVAEDSVLLQIQDAEKRYCLDREHLYAMGNSGGCLGIFQQVKVLPAGFFRAAACSGGLPSIQFLDTELLRSKGTCFLLLMSTEDAFDGQYTLREGYPYLQDRDVPVEFCPVGGGSHLLGWTLALEDIFGFFCKHS